jgi:hypothetical protein
MIPVEICSRLVRGGLPEPPKAIESIAATCFVVATALRAVPYDAPQARGCRHLAAANLLIPLVATASDTDDLQHLSFAVYPIRFIRVYWC